MIEPIGLVGTLIAIVQVCSKVVSVCYEYRSGVKDAPKDNSRILDEVTSVRNIAERLVKIAESDRFSESPSLHSMNEAGGLLHKCLAELVDLKTTLKLGKSVGLRTALQWPFKQQEAEKRLLVIGRIKSTLQLALSADNAQNILQILSHVQSLPLIHKKVSTIAEDIAKTTEDTTKKEVLRWLGGSDQSSKQQEEYEKYVKGTGDWLFHHCDYVTWNTLSGRLLWVNGNAGCGKTVLCANVIETLHEQYEGNDEVGLFYFYVDGSNQQAITKDHLLRSLMTQLASRKKRLPGSLECLYGSYGPGGYRQHRAIPAIKMQREIELVWKKLDDVFVILDGLDECDEAVHQEIVEFISKILHLANEKVHIIAFSRDLERLRQTFTELKATKITIDEKILGSDLRIALRHQLRSQPRFARWPASLKETVETSLLDQANGSFRWLDCQLQTLRRCATPVAVRKVLTDLPKSLEAYYTRVLESVDTSNRSTMQNLLRWVAFSLRPLSLDELESAIAINVEDNDVPFFDEQLELLDLEGFLDSCSTFVTTYCGTKDLGGEQKVYVRLAHFTVREFLLSDAIRTGICLDFAMERRLVHSCLAKSCLSYLHQAISSVGDEVWDMNPLASYAGYYWLKHKELADQEWTSPNLRTILLDMFAERDYYGLWSQVASVDRPWVAEGSAKQDSYSPLYCAAYNGLTEVAKALLDKGASTDDASGLYGNPLQAAAAQGHLGTVKVLLAANADLKTKGGTFGWAISAASANGHIEVVKELLAAGAEPQPPRDFSKFGVTDTLFLAASHGHLEVCELLLEHGAEDRFQMKARTGSALHAAVKTGRLDIVKAMLSREQVREANIRWMRGIVRESSGGIRAGQHSAAMYGHVDILRELAGYGIGKDDLLRYAARAGDKALVLDTLEQKEDDKFTNEETARAGALQEAAAGRHTDVVRELLARGIDPNEKTRFTRPLLEAIRGGSLTVVQILVEAGADVNTEYPYALDTALYARRRDIVDFLVQHGADVHKGLRRAAICGDCKSFQVLLELGADINAENPDDPTSILQAAAKGGDVFITKYILDKGAEVDRGYETTTPLVEAIRSQKWEVASLLMESGADVNAPPAASDETPFEETYYNGHRWPPRPAVETCLTIALREQSPHTARALMARGAFASPGTPDTTGTPLLHAVLWQYTDIVKMLLKSGADANQRGTILKRGKTSIPLLLAAEKRNIEIISHLIEAGARVDDQDDEGFSAVHRAAVGKDPAVLRTLVQDHHASINARLLNGSRPIHSAASKGLPEHVIILLDAGASVEDKNDMGRTPLHWAAESGNWPIVEMLLDRGADVNVESSEEEPNTPLDLAHVGNARGSWKWMWDFGKEWDEERLDTLLKRLV
ncbi:Fc.00g008260.m01.CDS01 [Cosmosporella sp. VM-42]